MERTEYLQEVILSVAVEGATQAQAVILPGGVQAQVEAEFRPAVVELQAQGSANLQEHGGQLLDLEHLCGGRFDLLGLLTFVFYSCICMPWQISAHIELITPGPHLKISKLANVSLHHQHLTNNEDLFNCFGC